MLAAEKGAQKIAVEIKSFTGPSVVDDLEGGLARLTASVALDQGFDVTAAYQRHRHRRRFVAVLAVHDAVVLAVQAVFLGDGADALLGTDQDGIDEPGFGGQ